MGELPTGTITMLFSDIEGSTRLLNRLGDQYGEALSAQRALLRAAFSACHGQEMGTEGDSFFVVFESAGDAVRCCVAAQRALCGHHWPGGVAVRVRMGLHSGEPTRHEDGYVGLDVHRAARIAAAAHGGQVVLSDATRLLVEPQLPADVSVSDLGFHRLKDIEALERIHQLVAPGLQERFPPLKSLGVHASLPVPVTPLIGRAGVMEEVVALLDGRRLVTVTGPGGVGKTRLAAEVAWRVAGQFADGACLVELAPVREPALVPAAAAVALGLPQAPGLSVTASLAAVLARQQLLLVLDNCEHVIDSAAELCGALLAAADDLRILATSREPLRVAGEARYRLPPLSVPQRGEQAEASGSEAVSFFVDRAQRVDPHFSLDRASGPAVAQLVTRLDGMPLAIELAAARVEALGVDQLLERLDDRLALLAGGDRGAAARHRSLAATVDWSYQLLSEEERRVFRQLSVFPGPFTLQAAEAVAGAAAGLAVLHLVDCSLLSPPRSGQDGRARYLMLETLRAYGAGQLAGAGEQLETAAQLAGYALRVAEQAAAGLETSTGEVSASRWLDAEDTTIHQALSWAIQHEPATALRLAVALAPWWRLRGRYAAGYELLRAATEQTEKDADAWWAAQVWLGDLAVGPTDEVVRLGHFTATRDALEVRAPSPMLVRALNGRADCLRNLGRLAEAANEAGHALATARELGDPAGEAYALYRLAAVEYYTGNRPRALTLLEQTQQINPATIPSWIARRCSIGLTTVLVDARDYPRARRHCAQALASAQQAGDQRDNGSCLARLTDIELSMGRVPEARTHLREALQIASRIGYRDLLSDCLDYCGYLCAATQRWEEAVTVWAARATAQRESGVLDLAQDARRRQEQMHRAQHALGPAQMRTADERGKAMSLTTAAEFATLQVTAEQQSTEPAPFPALSTRERELITMVAQGRTDAEIAGQLRISISTVRSHLARIRNKSGFRRRADLTRLALQEGLI